MISHFDIKIKYDNALELAEQCKEYAENVEEIRNQLKCIYNVLGDQIDPSIVVAQGAIDDMLASLTETEDFLHSLSRATVKSANAYKETQERLIRESEKLTN